MGAEIQHHRHDDAAGGEVTGKDRHFTIKAFKVMQSVSDLIPQLLIMMH